MIHVQLLRFSNYLRYLKPAAAEHGDRYIQAPNVPADFTAVCILLDSRSLLAALHLPSLEESIPISEILELGVSH